MKLIYARILPKEECIVSVCMCINTIRENNPFFVLTQIHYIATTTRHQINHHHSIIHIYNTTKYVFRFNIRKYEKITFIKIIILLYIVIIIIIMLALNRLGAKSGAATHHFCRPMFTSQ